MTEQLFTSVQIRRSIYHLTNESPISDDMIKEIVSRTIQHAPSPFNIQSTRAVILLKTEHQKLWDIALNIVKTSFPEQAQQALTPRILGFRAAYGSILWFEDEEKLDGLRSAHKTIAHLVTEWSDHSNGMHQFIAWTALELAGFGCNLQHYNFSPHFTQQVLQTWNLPQTYRLKSQLVFGLPITPAKERTYLPIDERVTMCGN